MVEELRGVTANVMKLVSAVETPLTNRDAIALRRGSTGVHDSTAHIQSGLSAPPRGEPCDYDSARKRARDIGETIYGDEQGVNLQVGTASPLRA